MIGCTELNLPRYSENVKFEVSLVDLNNIPINNETFSGSVSVNLNIGDYSKVIPVTTTPNDIDLVAYFMNGNVIINIPEREQRAGEVFYSFLLSGTFKLSDKYGAELVNYETKASKLCNFI